MTENLRQLWTEDPESVRAAGRELMALGRLLAEGRIEEAAARAEAAASLYPEWEQLDAAAAAFDEETEARQRAEAVREVALKIGSALLKAAVRQALGV